MQPAYVRPDSAVPASWPVGDVYLRQSEAALPAVTYRDIFRDPRLQALIEQALVNNRDLMVAAANIAAAREQVRIQRAQQFPQVDAGAGTTLSGSGSGSGVADSYQAGLSVPNFEVDLFGRLRSLTDIQRNRFFATEAAARATRLALVADIATAWLTYAANASLLRIAEDTVANGETSVRLTRASGGGDRAADRPPAGRADPRSREGRRCRPEDGARTRRESAPIASRRADRSEAVARFYRPGRSDDGRASRRAGFADPAAASRRGRSRV
jgi:hypothetical protein